jgi:hypothetical protein
MPEVAPPPPIIGGHHVHLATPRKLPRAAKLAGRVVVLDIAFASESGGRRNSFERTTRKLIDALGDRLVAWIDHHDSVHHAAYATDARFVLSTKAENGACPQMVTPERVARLGPADSVVCHSDFDGLASAAKWMRGGEDPYPACDADARAVDTRVGLPGPVGRRFDRALRARPRDVSLELTILRLLYSGLGEEALWLPIDEAGAELEPRERAAEVLAQGYRALSDDLVFLDVTGATEAFDRTWLLLLGQQKAKMACVADGDTVTFAAAFDSGVDFVTAFGLSGGMPTLVSLHRAKLDEALEKLGASSMP